VGSERGNAVLEAEIGEAKIAEDADPDTRSRFITAKYRNRAFVMEAVELDVFEAVQNQDLMGCYVYVAAGKLAGLAGCKFTPIHAAAVVGNPLILHFLCLNTPRCDVLDERGWSPLCYAAFYGQTEMANVLISYAAQLQKEGVNPYDVACSKHDDRMMAILQGCAEWSTFDANAEYSPARTDFQPAEFDMANWVSPTVNLNPDKADQGAGISEEAQERLNCAVSQLRDTLSGSSPGRKRGSSVRHGDATPRTSAETNH
jgi:hypothetical protein